MEDDEKPFRSRASAGIHMDIIIDVRKDVYRTFCMKQNSGPQTTWPNGKAYSLSLDLCIVHSTQSCIYLCCSVESMRVFFKKNLELHILTFVILTLQFI